MERSRRRTSETRDHRWFTKLVDLTLERCDNFVDMDGMIDSGDVEEFEC